MPQFPIYGGLLPTECQLTGEHRGDQYAIHTIDGGTGWHWTCCNEIDEEAP